MVDVGLYRGQQATNEQKDQSCVHFIILTQCSQLSMWVPASEHETVYKFQIVMSGSVFIYKMIWISIHLEDSNAVAKWNFVNPGERTATLIESECNFSYVKVWKYVLWAALQ